MLDAFETVLFQIYGRELDREHRFVCDAEGFRQTRKAELQAMARFAAQNVRKSGPTFYLRRIKFNRTSRHSSDFAGANLILKPNRSAMAETDVCKSFKSKFHFFEVER